MKIPISSDIVSQVILFVETDSTQLSWNFLQLFMAKPDNRFIRQGRIKSKFDGKREIR